MLTEFKLGNLVRNVNDKSIEITLSNNNIEDMLDENSLKYEGIPLTVEWLNKSSLKKVYLQGDGIIDFYVIEKIDYQMQLGVYSGEVYVIHPTTRELVVRLDYVHELQNFYKEIFGLDLVY